MRAGPLAWETSMVDFPWSDCKVAFGCDDENKLWAADKAGRLALPTGWSLNETDCSGARCVAIFRVEGALRVEDGNAVLATLHRVRALRRDARGVTGKEGETK